MNQRSDEQLVRDCLQANQDAWIALVRRYRQLVYSVIRSYHVPDADAADIFQSVWLEFYKSLPKLRDVNALRSWLITVTGHKCFRYKQSDRQPGGDTVDIEQLPGTDTPQRLAAIERQQILRQALDEVPLRCRHIIELLFLKDPPIPYAELASQLGLAVGSIGFIRKRCLTKLKSALERLGF